MFHEHSSYCRWVDADEACPGCRAWVARKRAAVKAAEAARARTQAAWVGAVLALPDGRVGTVEYADGVMVLVVGDGWRHWVKVVD